VTPHQALSSFRHGKAVDEWTTGRQNDASGKGSAKQ